MTPLQKRTAETQSTQRFFINRSLRPLRLCRNKTFLQRSIFISLTDTTC